MAGGIGGAQTFDFYPERVGPLTVVVLMTISVIFMALLPHTNVRQFRGRELVQQWLALKETRQVLAE